MAERAIGFRIAAWDTPLRVSPNRSPGRFNHTSSPPTQYASLHPLTPWAEYIRNQGLQTPEELAEHRLRIWALRLDLSAAAEVSFETAPSFGLEPWDLVGSDHGPCRDFADRLRAEASAPKTLIVPSAALPGTRNVVILGERVAIPYQWPALDEGDIPASIVAVGAQPPADLLPLVRHGDSPHAEHDAWAAGRRYRFDDLITDPPA